MTLLPEVGQMKNMFGLHEDGMKICQIIIGNYGPTKYSKCLIPGDSQGDVEVSY